jgi:hypothetical protein
MIAQSRREGKNRRDGATVSTRVLRLADVTGQKLFADTASSAQVSDEIEPTKKKGRAKTMQTISRL